VAAAVVIMQNMVLGTSDVCESIHYHTDNGNYFVITQHYYGTRQYRPTSVPVALIDPRFFPNQGGRVTKNTILSTIKKYVKERDKGSAQSG
jgi:hypothetical protein